MRKSLALLAVCAVVPFAITACGGDDDEESGATTPTTTSAGGGGGEGGASTVSLAADSSGAIAYDTDSLSAAAGDVTIEFDNPASLAHDVCVEGPDGEDLGCSDTIAQDQTTFDAGDLQAGDYTFYCSVDAHRDQGMEGTLTVK